MNGSQVIYVFFFFAVAITVVAGQSGSVDITDVTVTLTCPLEEDRVEWMQDNQELSEDTKTLAINEFADKNNGFYTCSNTNDKHYFYIKAKVCQSCVDLDMMTASAVVIGDVLFTFGIVLLVYYCTRKKSGTAAPQRATPGRQPRGPARGPPPPDPDYQTLIPATRSNDVYAQAQRR